MLKNETRLPLLPVKPLGDKVARAHAVSPLVESGRVFLPDQASWLREFLDEVTSFPAAPHDDQVDAMSQALGYLRENQYEPYRYSGLPYYDRPWRGSTQEQRGRDTCTEDHLRDDMLEGRRGGTFITGGAEQMRAISALGGRDRVRWPSLNRRRAW
jgi:hypothetical protein